MASTTSPILEVRGIERRFGAVAALQGIDLVAGPGEVVLLAGPNGAGKSTLLRCVAGLVRPSGGEILVGGHSLRRDPAARSLIGFLSHQSLLYEDLTARENLRFAAALHGLDQIELRVMDALNAAALTPRADLRTGGLSHGTRQRLAIARALLHRPRLLLLDEPFSGLDAAAAALLRQRVADVAADGCAVVCVTHHPDEIWGAATRTVVLQRGRVVADQPRSGLLADFLADYHARCVA
ncbi:MAG TPA: heme ABC exporter ATP-binding protein CcmA [Gemmatimonadales bacterium]|jgi:heme exporter protein A